MLLPFLVKALLDNRDRYARRAEEVGMEALVAEEPRAKGYLRPREGFRLYDERDRLTATLLEKTKENADWLGKTLLYPLAIDRKG
jgi:deoxyhypusine synthase